MASQMKKQTAELYRIMKNILIISNFYYPHIGGIEQTAHDCAEALKDIYNVKVICFNGTGRDAKEIIDGVEVIKCGADFKISSQVLSRSYIYKLKKMMLDYNPDIVIFNYPNPFSAHYMLKFLPKSAKLILYWHSDIIKQKILRNFFEIQNERLLKRADIIIATSPNYIKGSPYLRKYRKKCKVIPSCIDTKRLELSEAEKQKALEIKKRYGDSIICIAVGRHVEYKGFEYLIKAGKYLQKNIKVLLVGEGPLTGKLKKLSKGNANIVFLGRLSDEELREYLYISDIYCFPSITKNEAFGLSLAEAMYFGKPTVTFNIPGSGVNFVSKDKVTGLEVENRNIKKYASAMNLISNREVIKNWLAKNAKKRIEKNFLFDSYKINIRKLI